MKKILLIVLAVLILLTACKVNEEPETINLKDLELDPFPEISKQIKLNEEVSENDAPKTDNVEEVINLPVKEVTEGELVSFANVRAEDPDGDTVTYSFTKPLNSSGEWLTQVGEAGNYTIRIVASDGKEEVIQEVLIAVNPINRFPVISLENKEIVVNEGELVSIVFDAKDPEGEKLEISFSGWMQGREHKTGFNDAGNHTVKIFVSDGINEVSEEVVIIVKDVNRPPVFLPESFE